MISPITNPNRAQNTANNTNQINFASHHSHSIVRLFYLIIFIAFYFHYVRTLQVFSSVLYITPQFQKNNE